MAEELNIGALEPLSAAGADLVDHTAKGNFRALGKRFGKDTPRVAAAIAAADAEALAAALAADGRATVELDGEPIEVLPDEVIVSERPREGWSVVNEQGETVALDLEITPELRRAGLAREVIRMIQEARKAAGFEVSDRIALSWAVLDGEGAGELAEAMAEHRGLIAEEVLASTIAEARVARRARTDRRSPGPGVQRLPDLTSPLVDAGVPRSSATPRLVVPRSFGHRPAASLGSPAELRPVSRRAPRFRGLLAGPASLGLLGAVLLARRPRIDQPLGRRSSACPGPALALPSSACSCWVK